MITATVMKELKKKVKSSPALAKKGGLRKTCREKLYEELESLKILRNNVRIGNSVAFSKYRKLNLPNNYSEFFLYQDNISDKK